LQGQRQDSVRVLPSFTVSCPRDASLEVLDTLRAMQREGDQRIDSVYALLLRPPPLTPCEAAIGPDTLTQERQGGFWRTVDTWAPRVTAVAAVAAFLAVVLHHHKVIKQVTIIQYNPYDAPQRDDDDH
jgi:hypothetical protein